MSGTKSGGLKAAASNKARQGKDWYSRIGKLGGQAGRGPHYHGGFAGAPERAPIAGAKGGARSRRGHKFIRETPKYFIYINNATDEEVRFKRTDVAANTREEVK